MEDEIKKKELPWLFLTIESRGRELDSNLLLSCFAAEAGYGVLFGDRIYLDDILEHLAKGLFLDKGMINSNPYIKIVEKIKKLGNEYICIDEEGLVYEKEAYFANRFSPEGMEKTTLFFAWGEEHKKNIIDKFPQFSSKIISIGNPRVDLWRPELREYYHKDTSDLSSEHGPYILIASNFGSTNTFHSLPFIFKKMKEQGRIKSLKDEEYFKERFKYKNKLFEKFIEMTKNLSESFPEYKIIIRPHPAENDKIWEKKTRGLLNVKVVYDKSITPWILGCEALIHNSCTTGVEAYLLDKPVISYMPCTSKKFDSRLPNLISHQVFDVDSLIKLLKNIFSGEEINLNNSKNKDILEKYISSLKNSFASEKIVNALKSINIKKQPLFRGNSRLPILIKKTKRIIKEAIKDFFLIASKIAPSFFFREKINAWKNQRKIIPRIGLGEVEGNIKNLSLILDRFKKIKVFQISRNFFCIINKDDQK